MNFRTQQAVNKRKTIGLLVGMAVLVWLVVYAALTYFGTSTAGIAKVTEREFYEVEDPQDRNAPKVTF